MTNWYKSFMSIVFLLLSLHSVYGQIYVQSTATGSNDGTSWTNAYTDLNTALQAAVSGDVIWVAKGTYTPTSCSSCSDTDKSITFSIPSGVEVLGGFPDTGNPGIASRNWQTNTTILSGDIDGDGTSANNSFSIIRTIDVSNQTILDGFTLRDGNAANTSIGQGGGYGGAWFNQATLSMVSHPIVRNCIFTANEAFDGGAIYNNSLANFSTQTGSDANMDIINCTFTNNFAVNQGGAIYNDADFYGRHTGFYQDCVFTGNSASSDGGAIYNIGSIFGTIDLNIEGCNFSNNTTSVGSGGAIYSIGNDNGTINLLINRTSFSSNTALGMYGGAISSFMRAGILLDATIVNSTFRDNISMAGGALYSLGADSGNTQYQFVNDVFYQNIGTIGGAVYFNEAGGANVEGFFSNSIFKENTAPTFDPIFHYSGSPQMSIEHSIVYDVADCNNLLLGTGSIICGGGMQYLTDPLFADEANGNFRILAGSPAINTGLNSAIPAGITQDFDGAIRTSGTAVDIGAFEFISGTADSDSDGILDINDNCPVTPNADQVNLDGDLAGAACDCDDSVATGSTCTTGCITYYVDADGDGFGDANATGSIGCIVPAGFADNNSDCDDTNNTVYMGAPELCDNIDNNCNNQIDEGTDTDNDGVCNEDDICPGGDDLVDLNNNGTPDACESNVTIPDCPANINVTASAGQSAVTVNWQEPTATTTCTTGGGGGTGITCAGETITGYTYLGMNNGSHYYVSQNSATPADAQSAAITTFGGYLASINDAAENEFIRAGVEGLGYVLIGLEYDHATSTSSWVSGDAFSYTNYASISTDTNRKYGIMRTWVASGGAWELDFNFGKPYVVEVPCGGSSGPIIKQIAGLSNGSNFPVGTTTVTYEAIDACDNITTCSFDVTVTGGSSTISMTCPSDITLTTTAGATSAVARWADPVPTTDCTTGTATATLTSSIPSGGNFPIGTSTVTYSATDGCGNTTTCSFNVIVTAGSSAISMTCPADISLTADAGATSAVAIWTDPVPTTDCTTGTATATLTSSIPSGGNFPIGTSTVTYTATDDCGSTTTCSFQVTVTGSTSSTVSMTCPATINLTTSGGASTAVATWTAPTATTTCTTGGGGGGSTGGGTCTGAAIAGYDYIGNHNGSDYYISQSTAAWTTAEQIASLPVADGGAGGHLVAINDAAENDFIKAALGTNIVHIGLVYDNGYSWVNGDPVTYNNFSGTPSGLSYGVINFWDGSWGLEPGNNKLYVVEVACGGSSTSGGTTGGGTTGVGATVTQTGGLASGSSFPIGTTTVSYTATDDCGGTTTCSFDVIVTAGASTISMTCPSDITLTTAAGSSTAVATWADPVPTTDCTTGTATATLTSSTPSGGNFPIGTSTVTYTATDGCGNTTTCSFNVIVTAGSSTISMTCPADISLTADAGATSAAAIWTDPVPTTDCTTGTATATLTSSIPSGGNFPIGTSTVTYSATDDCGSTTTCSFQVTVQAASGGAISLTCPANISLTTAQGSGGIAATWTTPSATTTCTTGGGGGGGGTCSGAAITGYTYLGNFGSSDYYLSDATLPWPQANTQSIAAGGHLVYIESQEENDFILSQIGEVVFIGMTDENSEGTFTWSDGSALSYDNTQSFTPNSSSNNYGVIYNWAPGRWGYESSNVWKKYLLEVPCGGSSGGSVPSTVTLTPSIPSGSVFPVGTTTVTYTATDACNNTTSCSFTVTVSETVSNCQPLTDGGSIGNNESDCGPYTPMAIDNLTSPTGGSGTIEYLWLSSTSDCPSSVGQQIPGEAGASLTLGSISQTTYIVRWSRRVGCTSWTASNCVVKTVENCNTPPTTGSTDYCDANGQQPWEEWIANVSLADLNHPSNKSSSGYEDNTSLTANVVGGQSYQVAVTPGYSYTQRDENIYVWIDYNQNNDFSDPGELVFSTLAAGGTAGSTVAPVSGNIDVPASAINGTTRMRVALKATASTDPCGTFVQGEVEDYSVSISGATQGLIANIDLEAYHVNDETAILEFASNTSEPAIYELERSNDNLHFESLGTSHGNQISDDHPTIGTNYYRIKQVFEDGTIIYSDTKELVFGSVATAVTLYPNPASDQLFIRLDNLPSNNGTIVITNLLGQQMTQIDLQELGEQIITIPLDNYQSGMYLMHLSIEDQEYINTRTFVVEQE